MTRTRSRSLSYSEISTALSCEALARWDLQYGGHLGDACFKRRELAATLSNGRAWGAAVAAWHAFSRDESLFGPYQPAMARMAAHDALRASYAHDLEEQAERGFHLDLVTQIERENWLASVLEHYCSTAEPLPNLTRLEGLLSTPIPSRTGSGRGSSRYRFEGFMDGFCTEDEKGLEWVAEYKLRKSLTPPDQIQLSRQVRWYAWGRQKETGNQVAGVIVDERLAVAPKFPRLVKGRSKSDPELVPSHAKDQVCTPEAYVAVCEEFEVEPNPDTIIALGQRTWQQRVPILFRPDELEEAGRELVSAAKLIRDLDSGERYPIRNAQPHVCRGCRYLPICNDPLDHAFAETMFELRPPKRLRVPEEV